MAHAVVTRAQNNACVDTLQILADRCAALLPKDLVQRPGIPQDQLVGDVDGDGAVNIADVTALIDCLLSGVPTVGNGDIDGDGTVNIADVTALIDILLSGSN